MYDMNNRKSLITAIQETEFACLELNLYLDTHPNDRQAFEEFNKLSKKLRELKSCYDKEVGPLHNSGYSTSEGSWVYSTPWPWELQ